MSRLLLANKTAARAPASLFEKEIRNLNLFVETLIGPVRLVYSFIIYLFYWEIFFIGVQIIPFYTVIVKSRLATEGQFGMELIKQLRQHSLIQDSEL